MNDLKLSVTERVQSQPDKEWLNELEGRTDNDAVLPSQPTSLASAPSNKKLNEFRERVKEAGVIAVSRIGEKLLIKTDRHINNELQNRIKKHPQNLSLIAAPAIQESLYLYTGYRTFIVNGRPCLAMEFIEIHTGLIAERYFNIELRDRNNKYFKTGRNGKFHIKGSVKRPLKGTFIKTWMDAVQHIPDKRPSHIYRYMNSMLTGAIFSCQNTTPHHNYIKLTDLTFEGYLYDIE